MYFIFTGLFHIIINSLEKNNNHFQIFPIYIAIRCKRNFNKFGEIGKKGKDILKKYESINQQRRTFLGKGYTKKH